MARSALIVGVGQIGGAIAARLLDDGWSVRVAFRATTALPDGLKGRVAVHLLDREEPGALADAIGDGADAVIDTVAYDANHAEQLLTRRDVVGTYVVISSASVYCDDDGRTLDEAAMGGFPRLPTAMTERQRTVEPGSATYSTRKRALELRILESGAQTVVVRPCAVHGANSRAAREWWVVKRLLDGRTTIPLAFGGESRFHPSATVNVAAVVRAALDRPETLVLNAVDQDAPSVIEIAAAIMRAVGLRADLAAVDGPPPGPVGRTPWSVPRPFTLSDAAARAIGYRPVARYADAVGAACAWLVAHVPSAGWEASLPGLAAYPYHLFDYAAEDRWLADRGTSSILAAR